MCACPSYRPCAASWVCPWSGICGSRPRDRCRPTWRPPTGPSTSSVVVMVTTNRHKSEDAQYYATRPVRLTIGTSDTGRLIRAALWGLKGIYRPEFRYKKCGVLFLDLHPADGVQGSLFLRPDRPERVRLMDCIDQLNARYGRGLPAAGRIARGSCGRSTSRSVTPHDGASS